MKKINTKENNTILSTEGNQILSSRGDFVLGYKITYPEKYSLSEESYDSILSDWNRTLNILPAGSIVLKTDTYLKTEFDSACLGNENFLRRSETAYFKGRLYINHFGYIFFISPKNSTLQNNNIRNPFIFPKITDIQKEYTKQKDFVDNVEDCINMISKSGYISFTPLTEREIEKYYIFYFNGFQSDYLTDIQIQKEHIDIDNTQIGIFAITNERFFPDNVSSSVEDLLFSKKSDDFIFFQGFMDNIALNIKCNHIYNQIIFIDEHKIHNESIIKNHNNLKGISKIGDNGDYAEKIKEYREENKKRHTHYVRGHNNIIFWSDKPEDFDNIKKRISSELKNIGFRPYFATKEQLKNLFLNSFFTNVSCLDNNSLYLTDLSVCCTLFNNTGNYHNDENGIYLNDRVQNIPIRYDFWDYNKKYIQSRNFMIVAGTGRGKSFTANHIFTQLLLDNIIHVIIDLGDSFIKMAKLFPPEQVAIYKYKENEPLNLNPFSLINDTLNTDKIEQITAFVWTLIKRAQYASEVENTSMRKLIAYYYEVNPDIEHSWESFYSFIELNRDTILMQVGIENEEYFNISEFLHSGSDFVKEGLYANVLRSNDNSSSFIGKKLIIFELLNIADNKLLLSIMLQVISEAINRVIWKDKKNRGIVFFDEFAKQLKFPEILGRVEFYAQAIRKQNGSLGLIIQNFNQLPENDTAKSIIDNTETFAILPAGKHTTTIKRLELSKHHASQLNSMKNQFSGDTMFSEIYIYRKTRNNVFRIEVSPETYLAFQTEGEIHEKIVELYEKSGNMEEAIKKYMKSDGI